MPIFDSVLAILLLIGIIRGFMKGFVYEVAVLGAMFLGFYAAFHLDGESDTTINTLDIDGINMAAIQALKVRTDELKAALIKLEEKTKEVAQLKSDVQKIKEQLGLEAK